MKSCLALLAATASTAAAGTAFTSVVPPESLCCGWAPTELSLSPSVVSFSLTLSERNNEQVKEIALAVSTPSDPSYGQHLTAQEIDDLTAPDEDHLLRLTSWLDEHGVEYEVTRGRHVAVTDLSLPVAKNLLHAEFTTIARHDSEHTRAFATHYELPSNVAEVVDAVYGLSGVPTTRAPVMMKKKKMKNEKAPEFGPPHVTPIILSKTYNVTTSATSATNNSTNKQAIVSFLGEEFSVDDVNTFFKMYVSNTTQPPPITCVGPKSCEGGTGAEASLDIQYLIGMSPTVATEGWYFDGQTLDFCGTVRAWTQALLSAKTPPLVSSVSYGFSGDLTQSGCTAAGILGVENDLAAAAARGLTIILASGDEGNGEDPTRKLYPSWPGTSPWVTAVGATAFIKYKVYGPEEAAHYTFASGGGFAWNMERLPNATYQDASVKNYFAAASRLPPSGAYHASGVGSPDVSALGQGYLVIQHGRVIPCGGTSAATPMFAGLVSRLNEERLAKGMAPMGFLNPWIYSNQDAFTDITVGWDSKNGKGDKLAFPCAKGWDPVTGVGTPNYGRMVEAALKAGEAVAPLSSPSELHQCNSDADCSDICTYCQNGAGKTPPFVCHAPTGGCCLDDQDCDGSYCMNGPGHAQPWKCHGGQ